MLKRYEFLAQVILFILQMPATKTEKILSCLDVK